MLKAIDSSGPSGLSTRKISRIHGWETLIKAEQDGLVRRTTAHNAKGGPDYVMNSLTSAGRRLLRELGEEV